MKKQARLVGFADIAVAIAFGADSVPLLFIPYPLVKPWLLHHVPTGSSVGDLRAEVASENWKVRGDWVVGPDESTHPFWFLEAYEPKPSDARSIVWVSLGGYRVIFRTDYDSFWYFDENGKLTGVHFRKMVDAL